MSNITLHPGQSQVFQDLFIDKVCRHAVVICSRGWGKSYLAGASGITAVFELLQLDDRVPNKNIYLIAPTYSQVTDIYYPMLAYQMDMEGYCKKSSRDLGKFWFPKDVELKLVSFEAIERLRGTGAYFAVLDEPASWESKPGLKEAWEGILWPCINTRWSAKRAKVYGAESAGRSMTIGTPKGYNYLYDMYNYRDLDSDWKSYNFDYTTSPYLDTDEIEKMRNTLDPIVFSREYQASFKDSGNNIFYCFDRTLHVQKDLKEFEEEEDVHVGIDFNVGLQCSSAFALRGNEMHYLEEFKGHPDTESLAISIKARYKNGKRRVYVYPDPTGKSRKTSAPVGQTDFSILQSQGLIVRARNSSPPIVDSVNAVNAKLKTAAGNVSLYLHPRCQGTILSLERTSWLDNNPNTATIDKSEGIEHFSDNIRYSVEYLFPIRKSTKVVSRGFNF